MLNRILESLAPLSPLMIRLPLGAIFVAHGAQKLFGLLGGRGIQATIHDFDRYLGIPPFLTVLAVACEFFGGLAVLIGYKSRLAALGLAAIMVVAMVRIHAANGFFINWSLEAGRGHGIEMNLALLGMCLALATAGPGRYALGRSD